MAEKLKIYACSGIGSTEPQNELVKYWTDGTNTITNTQAVNTLLAQINLRYIEAVRLNGITKAQKIQLLCEIDWLNVALDLVKRNSGNAEKLQRAGQVICTMAYDGDFNFDSLNSDKRSEHLEDLMAGANAMCNEGGDLISDPEFMAWWQTNVIERDKVGLNFGEQQKVRKAVKKAVAGIGEADPAWKEDADLAEYLTKGSEYFLYLYFTKEQLKKLPYVFEKKANKQARTYEYCKALFVGTYGSEQEMKDIIRAGIINYFSETPEQVCAEIVSGKREVKSVGISDVVLVAIIEGCFALVTAIITAICTAVAISKQAEYAAIDRMAVEQSTPEGGDFDGLFSGSPLKASSLIPIAAIVCGIVLLAKK